MVDSLAIEPLRGAPNTEPHSYRVPGSKSITNRALLLAALAAGESTIERALFSDDTHYMSDALRRLGIPVDSDPRETDLFRSEVFHVQGCGGSIPAREARLETGNAGTAARFLVACACLGHGRFIVDGNERMRQRPIGDLLDALRQLGARVSSSTGCPPVTVDADSLPGGTARVKGERSSQYLSALLMVAPYAQHDVELEVVGELIAKPYVDLTLGVMNQFGVTVARDGYQRFHVSHGQCYRAQVHYLVEPDASSAHYLLAAAALTGMLVRVEGLTTASLQGDARFVEVLEQMGATVTRHPNALEVLGPSQLRGIDVDLNAISDTAPTVAVLATFASSASRVRNVAHIRLQESDRIGNVVAELRKLGARIEEHDDGWTIEPSSLHGGEVEPYDDHRLAMAFSLIGLRVPGIVIRNPGCVRKTFPDFFEQLQGLRVQP
ncbi:MAG: 3-phosphoshikimate 1-carboxyvinyltransferase [Candidatus Binatia bacterium]